MERSGGVRSKCGWLGRSTSRPDCTARHMHRQRCAVSAVLTAAPCTSRCLPPPPLLQFMSGLNGDSAAELAAAMESLLGGGGGGASM